MFMKIIRRNISDTVRNKIKSQSHVNSNLVEKVVSIKTKFVNDHYSLIQAIANNFPIKNNSQIYYKDDYYISNIKIINGLRPKQFDLNFKHIMNNFHDAFVSIDKTVEFQKQDRKLSLLNRGNVVGGIINVKMFPSRIGDVGHINGSFEEVHDCMGEVYDKLYEKRECYDVIEIQGEGNIPTVESENYEYSRIMQFLQILQNERTLDDKLISIRTNKVNNVPLIY